jgi:AcrR family transcriptional regulator
MTLPPQTTTGYAQRSLADRKRSVTREAVVDAVIEAIRDSGIDFSVQDVADRAGVTHRTVYRYFSSRQALVDAADERFERWLAAQGMITQFGTLDGLLGQIETLFRLFDGERDLIRAVALHMLVTGERTALSRERTAYWRRMFERNRSSPSSGPWPDRSAGICSPLSSSSPASKPPGQSGRRSMRRLRICGY